MLRDRARELGLCNQWYKGWKKKESKQELIDKYIRGIDFCIEHDYPKLDFVRAYFSKKILNSNGVFLDDTFDVKGMKNIVLLGSSKGNINYCGNTTGNVYVRHESKAVIKAVEGAKVFVETYEGCSVEAFADEHSRIFLYKHGGSVKTEGNVIIRDKVRAEK